MAKIANVQEVSLNLLRPYERNAKKHGQGQIEKLKASIMEFGFLTPCLIDNEYNLIAGHGRVMAAKELGVETVPCVFIDGLSEEQRRAYILADNRLGELGEWDMELVWDELAELDNLGFDVELTGFDMPEELPEVIEDDFDESAVPDEPRTKLGDIYQLGQHRLICGDSTDVNVIDRLMDGVKADMVFTDPPYNMQMTGGCIGVCANMRKVEKDIESISSFDPKPFLEIIPAIFDKNMNTYIFCNKDLVVDYLNWGKENGYSYNILVWKKPNSIPVGDSHRPDLEYLLLFRKNAIWNNGLEGVNYSRCLEYSRVKKSDTTGNHPTVKPIELIGNEIKISSKVNSIVVDFFGGSGSTLIACEQLNRKCYMCELDPHYCDVIINRWETLTGREAVLIDG